MNEKIYWYCFKRQCREFYELLRVYKLISCSLEEFMSHFTGKKFYDDEVKTGAKLLWYGDEKILNKTASWLAEKGFIDKESGSYKAMEKHFKFSDIPTVISKKFPVSLKALFPETTGYRCKTRLYYKERNKKSNNVLVLCQDFRHDT
jgi:hypothetical protein